MKYKVRYNPSNMELWQLHLYGIYSSLIGVINIVFTIAMLFLANRFWTNINLGIKTILLIVILYFPVFQPIIIYVKVRKQVKLVPDNMKLGFNDEGIYILTSKENTRIEWKSVMGVNRVMNMLVIYTSNKQGYVISDRVLGDEKDVLLDFILKMIKDNSETRLKGKDD